MKEYILDTMALVRLLEDTLPKGANAAVKGAEKGENTLLVPEIVLGEFMYIALRGRLGIEDPQATIGEVLTHMRSSRFLSLVHMDFSCWETFLDVNLSELHDRMICSIAVARNAPVMTDDKDIASRGGVKTVWS